MIVYRLSRYVLLAMFWLAIGLSQDGQMPVAIPLKLNEDSELKLETDADATYFLETSPNLIDWSFAGPYEIGDGLPRQEQFNQDGQRLFFRYRAVPTNLDNPHDTDNDGILNEAELSSYDNAYNPLIPDSDDNGTLDGAEDFDGDGLANQSDPLPTDWFNGMEHTLSVQSGGNQIFYYGGVSNEPIVYRLTDEDGNPLGNAPLTITSGSLDGAMFSLSEDGANPLPTLENLRTDENGEVTFWYVMPEFTNGSSQSTDSSSTITATTVTGNSGGQQSESVEGPNSDEPKILTRFRGKDYGLCYGYGYAYSHDGIIRNMGGTYSDFASAGMGEWIERSAFSPDTLNQWSGDYVTFQDIMIVNEGAKVAYQITRTFLIETGSFDWDYIDAEDDGTLNPISYEVKTLTIDPEGTSSEDSVNTAQNIIELRPSGNNTYVSLTPIEVSINQTPATKDDVLLSLPDTDQQNPWISYELSMPSLEQWSATLSSSSSRVEILNPELSEGRTITYIRVKKGSSFTELQEVELNATFTSPVLDTTLTNIVSLLPVDLDIVHPETGELSDAKEDVDDGGYVSIKREVDGVDVAPVTELKIHALDGLPSAKFRLKFSSGGKYNIFDGFNPVQSEITEFNASSDVQLYFQGEEITMQIDPQGDGNWVDGDSVKFTVVQSEFQVQLRCFIPFVWTEGEFSLPSLDPTKFVVAGGDDRTFETTYSSRSDGSYADTPFRMMQEIVLTPYEDLSPNVDNESERKTEAAEVSKHYDKHTQVPASQQSQRYGGGPMIGPPYVDGEAFLEDGTSPYYKDLSRQNKVASAKLNLGGQDGAMFLGSYLTALFPDINWTVDEVSVDVTNPLSPKVYIGGRHDRYPAYEAISLKDDGEFEEIYQFMPESNELPGPYSLGGIDPIHFHGEN